MDIDLTFSILGHAVRLHFCIGGGKLVPVDDEEGEMVDLRSETTRLVGFQPNPEREEDDE